MKVGAPLFAEKAHGSLAGLLTYQDRETGGVVYLKKDKRDAESPSQLVTRNDYKNYLLEWQSIPESDKKKWNDLAIEYGISGINLFMMWWFTELYNSISGVGFSNGTVAGAERATPKLNPYYLEEVRKKIYGE